jgi:hypothetical protein
MYLNFHMLILLVITNNISNVLKTRSVIPGFQVVSDTQSLGNPSHFTTAHPKRLLFFRLPASGSDTCARRRSRFQIPPDPEFCSGPLDQGSRDDNKQHVIGKET